MAKRPKLRERLTYANVMSSIAVFLVIGGGAAFAAVSLPKNSVGSRELKPNAVKTSYLAKNAVKTGKIAPEAVRAGKIARDAIVTNRLRDGAVTGGKVQDGSLTGADINQASLNDVRAGNVTAIAITDNGSCSAALPLPAGVTSQHTGIGECRLTFPSAVSACTATATVHYRVTGTLMLILGERSAQLFSHSSQPNVLRIETYEREGLADLPFDLVLVC